MAARSRYTGTTWARVTSSGSNSWRGEPGSPECGPVPVTTVPRYTAAHVSANAAHAAARDRPVVAPSTRGTPARPARRSAAMRTTSRVATATMIEDTMK